MVCPLIHNWLLENKFLPEIFWGVLGPHRAMLRGYTCLSSESIASQMGLNGMPGIEPRLTACKANALLAVYCSDPYGVVLR